MAIGDKFISFLPQFYTFKLRGICEGGHHPARAQVSCGGWASSIFKACFLIIVNRIFRVCRHDNQAHYIFFCHRFFINSPLCVRLAAQISVFPLLNQAASGIYGPIRPSLKLLEIGSVFTYMKYSECMDRLVRGWIIHPRQELASCLEQIPEEPKFDGGQHGVKTLG